MKKLTVLINHKNEAIIITLSYSFKNEVLSEESKYILKDNTNTKKTFKL
jgi:hypothetical protein